MKASVSDRALRYGGGLSLALLALLCIVATLFTADSTKTREEMTLLDRIMFSSSFVENWFYDMRARRFYDHDKKSPNLVVVEISDESLAAVGRWPWTRARHAKMIDHLGVYGARIIGFDMLFPEPESPAADGAFAGAIQRFVEVKGARRAVIIGYDLTDNPDDSLASAPEDLVFSVLTGSADPNNPMAGSLRWINKNNFISPSLMQGFTNLGYISARPDPDGVFRHAKLVSEADVGKETMYFPSLGLAAFQSYYNNTETGDSLEFLRDPNTQDFKLLMKSRGGERAHNMGDSGEIRLRFFGGAQAFTTVAAERVLNDPNPARNEEFQKIFAGKTVLIGSSAFGAHDLRHLPTDPLSPGMYIHANLFHALDQNFVFQNDYLSAGLSAALCLLGALAVLLLARLREPLWESLGALTMVGAVFALDYFYLAPSGHFIRLFSALFGVLAPYGWITFLNVFKEAQEKRKIKDAFSRYVAPEIVKEMLANPDKLKVGGEKREITMLFSDVRDFTTISERLSPQELATLLNIYMGRMTDILFETGGTLDKYIGDAMVGFWGAPLEIPDHAYQAVRGAKQMLEALPAINHEFEKRKFPRVNVGIGLNTGDVSVGNMGSDKIFQYTALGDNMNLASRLEGLTKYYGVNLMISEFTCDKLGAKRSEFKLRPLDLVQVKGKSKAVKIFEVIPNWNPLAKEDGLLEKYVDAYEGKYLKRRFQEAGAVFQEILSLYPEDKASLKLLHSAEEYLRSPPGDDWDGVTVFTSK